MAWYIILTHIALAVALFFLVNWIGEHATPIGYMQLSIGMKEDTAPILNYLFKVLAPVVFVILVAAVFQLAGVKDFIHNIYLIVVYYWAIRLVAVFVLGHARLINWPLQVLYWLSSIGLAYWIFTIIEKIDTLFPSPQSIIEQLWFLIILFIYSVFNKLNISRTRTEHRKQKYIDHQYNVLFKRYGKQVNDYFKGDFLRALTFSIMIYENYNRSLTIRAIERFLGKNAKKKHTYGIMQVMSDHVLSDEESITMGMQKIENDVKKAISDIEEENISCYRIINNVSNAYNGGDDNYSEEICAIFLRLKEKYYRDISEILKYKDLCFER